MKKYLTILSLFISMFTFSQSFDGGIYAGLSASQIDGDNFYGFNKAGPILGAFVDTYFDRSKTWGAQLDLRYIEKGSSKTLEDGSIYYKAKLHYIEMPVSVKYLYKKKFEMLAGLSFAYLLSAKEKKDGVEFVEADPPFNSFELAGFAGLNYHFNDKWAVGAQYMYSILKIRGATPNDTEYTYRGQYNNLTLLTLFYKIEGR